MDLQKEIEKYLPINSNEKVDALLECLYQQAVVINEYVNTTITCNIHKLKTQIYFKERIEQYNNSLPNSGRGDAVVKTIDNLGPELVSGIGKSANKFNKNKKIIRQKIVLEKDATQNSKHKIKPKKHRGSHRHKNTKQNLPKVGENVWDRIAYYGGTNGPIIKINAGHGRRR